MIAVIGRSSFLERVDGLPVIGGLEENDLENVQRSLDFYSGKLGVPIAWNSVPAFAMLRMGAGTIGLLALAEAAKEGVQPSTPQQKAAVHVEFTTDDLDALHEELKAKGVAFHQPPHDEPWERSMTAYDPDGYAVEFAQGKRGKNQTSDAGIGEVLEKET